MKKPYNRKQIAESIRYWSNILRSMERNRMTVITESQIRRINESPISSLFGKIAGKAAAKAAAGAAGNAAAGAAGNAAAGASGGLIGKGIAAAKGLAGKAVAKAAGNSMLGKTALSGAGLISKLTSGGLGSMLGIGAAGLLAAVGLFTIGHKVIDYFKKKDGLGNITEQQIGYLIAAQQAGSKGFNIKNMEQVMVSAGQKIDIEDACKNLIEQKLLAVKSGCMCITNQGKDFLKKNGFDESKFKSDTTKAQKNAEKKQILEAISRWSNVLRVMERNGMTVITESQIRRISR